MARTQKNKATNYHLGSFSRSILLHIRILRETEGENSFAEVLPLNLENSCNEAMNIKRSQLISESKTGGKAGEGFDVAKSGIRGSESKS